MTKIIEVNECGTLTLPEEMRRRLGIKAHGQVVVEEIAEGVLLRKSVTVPVEVYSDKRLAEFARNDENVLSGYKLKLQSRNS